MKCFSEEVLKAYIYDELGEAARRVIDTHVMQCNDCQEKVERYRGATQEIIKLLKREILMKMSAEAQLSPTTDTPTTEQINEWFLGPTCEATDGCIIEHDGACPHGHPSWLKYLGLI